MHPIYLHEYKIAIWWSAKCGCSTIKEIIYNYVLKKNVTDVYFEYCSFEPKYLGYKNILIVRNPIDRIISCFMNKYFRFRKENFNDNDYNFKTFIENPENNKYDFHHTGPQFSEYYDNLINYCKKNDILFKFDEIIKLEEFDENLFAKKFFGIELNKNFQLNKTHKSNNFIPKAYLINGNEFTNNSPLYISFLNKDIIETIKKIYQVDYDILHSYGIEYPDYAELVENN